MRRLSVIEGKGALLCSLLLVGGCGSAESPSTGNWSEGADSMSAEGLSPGGAASLGDSASTMNIDSVATTGNSGASTTANADGEPPGETGAGATSGSAAVAGEAGSTSETEEPLPLADATAAATACDPAAALNVGVTRLRRLTRASYNNAVRDVLSVSGTPAEVIEADESIGPFASNGISPVTDLIVEQYRIVAEGLAGEAPVALAGCELAENGCAQSFIESLGLRLYRRPLTASELASYQALYTLAESESEGRGFTAVVETLLQSPNYLYHVEVGADGTPSVAPVPLTGYELASRLSFFIWNSVPDTSLLTDAAAGALTDPATLQSQVQRLLADDRAGDSVPLFHERLLGIQRILGVSKDPEAFPAFNDELKRAMLEESRRFSDYVVREGDGLLSTLLSADYSVIDGPLFDLYGVEKPSGFESGQVVMLDATERAGLLTQAAFLSTHAHPDQTSPVHRGILVRENLLCMPLPAPPADVDNVIPAATPTTTTRQRLEQHVAEPRCAGCHLLIDPIGLGFENYDTVGAYRVEEGGQSVDAVGELTNAGEDAAGTFDGAVALSKKLAQSVQVQTCIANQWFRFALGRIESTDDACSLDGLYTEFENSGGNVRSLIGALAVSGAFTHVRTLGTEEER